ncbi:hypothetical protein CR983_03015, partial [Candidatus Saccharibacteria bacterium]
AKTIIIDTREPSEYAASHVDGAINIPPADFMSGAYTQKLGDIAKDTPIILYCRSGARSNTCSQILAGEGYTDLTNGVNEHHVRKLLETRE